MWKSVLLPSSRWGGLYISSRGLYISCRDSAYHVHPGSYVHETATLSHGVVIERGAKVGAGVVLGANSVVGSGVSIGHNSKIGYNVSLSNCKIGSNVVIFHGTCIGQDGFGHNIDPQTGELLKKEQELSVEIGHNVEIGAACTIDRGSWRNTSIGDGCKLDNQVHLAHNVVVGNHCAMAAMVGIAGSVTIGNRVLVGGQVGIAQHLQIGDDVHIAAKSGVMHNLLEKGKYGGVPAIPLVQHHRQTIALRKLAAVSYTE